MKSGIKEKDGKSRPTVGGDELEQTRKALQRTEKERADLFNAIGSPIIIMDPEHHILDANNATLKLLNLGISDIKGHCCWEFFHGTDCAAEGCPMRRMLESHTFEGEFMPMETVLGTYLVSCTPVFDDQGGLSRVIHVATDITERKRLEARLKQAEKMKAIGHLAGGIAHDFNNQLSGIMGYAELLRGKLREPDLRRYTEGIMTAAARAADLTEKLLDFARHDNGRSRPVDLHRIICEVTSMLSRSMDRRIRLVQKLEADSAIVLGDESDIQNALLNLGINARDAMPEGGEITFSTATVMVKNNHPTIAAELAPGPYLRLQVSDTGFGIPDDVLEHVLEPFFTTKKNGKGTGMGLALVYSMVQQHHGSLEILSKTGAGTTIEIHLPLAAQRKEEQAFNSRQPLKHQMQANILIADDEEQVCDICADMLEELGHRVTAVTNGKDAVEYYQARWQQIDLVILDMRMPKMSGVEAFYSIRRINPKAKILICSGFSQNREVQELLDQGALGFIRKPFRFNDLNQTVGDVLQK